MKKSRLWVIAVILTVLFGLAAFGCASKGSKSFTVTFDANGGAFSGGEVLVTQTVDDSGHATAPDAPVKSGSLFLGWFADSAATTPVSVEDTVIHTDVTFFAGWQRSVEVTYNLNYSGAPNNGIYTTTTAGVGSLTTKPADPTRSGYAFAGWYVDNSCSTEWIFSSNKVTDATVLYAKWVEVVTPTITSISATASRTLYTVGQTFDASTLTVTAHLSDSSSRQLSSSEYTVNAPAFTSVGSAQITITLNANPAVSTTVSVTVTTAPAPTVTSISATDAHGAYEIGETINKSTFTVTATLSNGSTRPLEESEFSVSGSTVAAGPATVTVTYLAQPSITTTVNITVSAEPVATVTSISATDSTPSYEIDGSLSKSTFTVIATLSDDSTRPLSESEFSLSGNLTTPGNHVPVTVTYLGGQGITTIVYVTVNEPSVVSISATASKLTYTVGERFNETTVTVTANMSAGAPQTLEASDYTIDPVDTSTAGTVSVTVKYNADNTISTSFNITVEPASETVPDGEYILGSFNADTPSAAFKASANSYTDPAPGTTYSYGGAEGIQLHLHDTFKLVSYSSNAPTEHAVVNTITVQPEGAITVTKNASTKEYEVTGFNLNASAEKWYIKYDVKNAGTTELIIELAGYNSMRDPVNAGNTITAGSFAADKVYLAGNFTGGYQASSAWSSASTLFNVVESGNIVTFERVYLKRYDAFQVVVGGATGSTWYGYSGTNFTVLDTPVALVSGGYGNNISLAPLASADGFFDVVIDVKSTNKTLTIRQHVDPLVVESLTMQGTPTKTTYYTGEPFDPAGLTFKVTYDDDTEGTLDADEIAELVFIGTGITDNVFNTPGTVQVRAKFGNVVSSNDVTVTVTNAPEITGFVAEFDGTATEYTVGDRFKAEDYKFYLVYDNDDRTEVSKQLVTFTSAGLDNNDVFIASGEVSIVASYNGRNAPAFTVTVKEAPAELTDGYYLLGSFNNWGSESATVKIADILKYKMTHNTWDDCTEDTLNGIDLKTGDTFKIVRYDSSAADKWDWSVTKDDDKTTIELVPTAAIDITKSDDFEVGTIGYTANAEVKWNVRYYVYTAGENIGTAKLIVAASDYVGYPTEARSPVKGGEKPVKETTESAEVYIKGNFTDGFAAMKEWSDKSAVITVAKPTSSKYVFKRVYMQCFDTFKMYVKTGGKWYGISSGKFELGKAITLSDAGSATDINVGNIKCGIYDIEFDTSTKALKMSAVTNTVTFNMNVGHEVTAPAAQVVGADGKITKPQTPVLTGFTFVDWYENAEATGDPFDFGTVVDTDMTLYAKWNAETYTLKFDVDGGEAIADGQYTATKVDGVLKFVDKTLAPATKTGYTFTGWYINGQIVAGNKLTYAHLASADAQKIIALDAGYTVNSYPITYVGNKPTDAPVDLESATVALDPDAATTADFGATIARPEDPVLLGYTFTGWYTDSACAAADAFDFDAATMGVDGITLYAGWRLTDYTVTFDGNKPTGAPVGTTVTLAVNSYTGKHYGDLVTKPADPTISYAAYSFGGWYYLVDTVETDWNFATDKVTGNITLYARWNAVTHTVSYELEGAPAGVTAPAPEDVLYGGKATAPEATEAVGYTISYKVGGNAWNFESTVTEDTVITVVYTPVVYSVSYDKAGGSDIPGGNYPATYKVTDGDVTLSELTLAGNTFAGWYVVVGGVPTTRLVDNKLTPSLIAADTASIALKAVWTVNKYDVTYNANAGSDTVTGMPADEKVEYGKTATEPETAPTRTGYTFGGWYTDEGCADADAYDFGATVTSNVELFAKWTPRTQNITYVNNLNELPESVRGSVTGAPVDTTKPYDSVIETAPAMALDHYSVEWYTDAERTDKATFPMTVEGDVTLYAKWTCNDTFSVMFNGNKTTGMSNVTGVPATINGVWYGAYITRPADPACESHNFIGWFKERECTHAWDFDTDTVTAGVNLYAKWEIKQFSVTFDANVPANKPVGSDVQNLTASETVNYNGKITPQSPTLDGFTFGGWYENAEGTGNAFDVDTAITRNVDLYAKWTPAEYTITYTIATADAERASINGEATEKYTYGVSHTLFGAKKVTVSDNAYTFAGWYVEGNDTLVSILDAGTFGDKTFVAKIVAASRVNVTFDLDYQDEHGADVKTTVSVVQGYAIPAASVPSTSRTGYTFAHWTKDGVEFNMSTPITENTTLVAVWSVNKHAVLFDKNTDDENVTGMPNEADYAAVEYGTAISKTTDPSRTGYTFGGWFTDSACADEDAFDFDNDLMPDNDLVLYAKWTANNVTVTYALTGDVPSGVTAPTAVTVSYGTVISLPAGLTVAGYALTWSDGAAAVTFPYTAVANVTLTGTYVHVEYNITINVSPTEGGTVTGAAKAHYNDNVTLTVTPAEGYELLTLTVDGTDIKSNKSFTMPESDVTVSATFGKISYTITIGEAVNGTVTVDGGETTAQMGDTVTLSATPAVGYELNKFTVDGEDIDGNTFTMPAKDVTVSATFRGLPHSITIDSTITNGTVTVKGGATTARTGDTVELTVTPAEGYALDTLKMNGTDIKASKSFTMPNADVTITATFVKTAYTITIDSTIVNGSVSVEGNIDTANTGEEITIIVTPDTGYELATLTANGEDIKATKKYTMKDENVTISATFVKKTYTVTFNVDGGTAIADQTVKHGEKATKPADPKKVGYTFGGWFKNSAKTVAYNFETETVTGPTTIYAKWTAKTYTDGLYIDDEHVKDLTDDPNTAGKVQAQGIVVAPGQIVTFRLNNAFKKITLESGAGMSADFELVSNGDGGIKSKAAKTGAYSFYLNKSDGKLWIANETGYVVPTLKDGDGIYVGGETKPKATFSLNNGNMNEVYALSVKVGTSTETTAYTVKLVYGGKNVTVTNLESALGITVTQSGVNLTMYAGTYNFYYCYGATVAGKVAGSLWIEGTQTGTAPTPVDPTVSANQMLLKFTDAKVIIEFSLPSWSGIDTTYGANVHAWKGNTNLLGNWPGKKISGNTEEVNSTLASVEGIMISFKQNGTEKKSTNFKSYLEDGKIIKISNTTLTFGSGDKANEFTPSITKVSF